MEHSTSTIGERLRSLRKQKKLSQADLERRSGLLRPYLSRVEQGHVVPSIISLEKMARALEVRLYQLFYDEEAQPKTPRPPKRKRLEQLLQGTSPKNARFLRKLHGLLGRIGGSDRRLLLQVAQRMSRR